MAFQKYVNLEGQVFLLDYELSRQDSFGYQFFSYKILNTLVIFRSPYLLQRHQPVAVSSILETHDSIIIELSPYEGNDEITDILSVVAYKVPLAGDFELNITGTREVDIAYAVVDSDQHNSKVGFVVLSNKHANGEITFPIEGNYTVRLTLTH